MNNVNHQSLNLYRSLLGNLAYQVTVDGDRDQLRIRNRDRVRGTRDDKEDRVTTSGALIEVDLLGQGRCRTIVRQGRRLPCLLIHDEVSVD
jgi:hypothetical protein